MRSVIHPETRKRDHRYVITREWCGRAKPQWVARFCDDWLGCAPTQTMALAIALRHQAKLYGKMGIPLPHTHPFYAEFTTFLSG